MIHVIREELPSFDPDPGRTRTKIGEWWVEWSGTEPTPQEVSDYLKPLEQINSDAAARADRLRQKMRELADKTPSRATNNAMKYDAVNFCPDRPFRSETQKNQFETENYCLSLNGAITLHLKRCYLDQLLGVTPVDQRQVRKWYLYCAHLNSLYLLLDAFAMQGLSIAYFNLEEITTQNTDVVSQHGIGIGPRSNHKLITSPDEQRVLIPDEMLNWVNQAFEKSTTDFECIYVISELAKSLAAYKSADFATSFVLAWFMIERFVDACWERYLERENEELEKGRQRIAGERMKNLKAYTVSVKSQILELGREISLDQLTVLDKLRQKRNAIVHPRKAQGEKVAFQADAKNCQDAFNLLEYFVSKDFGIALAFNTSYSCMGVFDQSGS